MAILGSPFTPSGSAVRLPAHNVDGKLVIRFIGSADTDYILIKIDTKEDVTAEKADFVLYSKESIKISHLRVKVMSDVSIMIGGGSGSVYWGAV